MNPMHRMAGPLAWARITWARITLSLLFIYVKILRDLRRSSLLVVRINAGRSVRHLRSPSAFTLG